jgi:three-Cys-motif partner protein
VSPKKEPSGTPLFPGLETPPRPPRRNRKKLGIPASLDLDKYERAEDGRLQEIVGSWVKDKHAVLEKYVGYTRAVRKKWVARGPAGATYIDLFSGPGQVRIKDTKEVLPGSPLVAWRSSDYGPFTDVYVADAHAGILTDCVERLREAGAPVQHVAGEADATVDEVIKILDKRSYHFAFLDPFNLGSLSFEVIRKLAGLYSIDILAHVSAQDLNRNLRLYIEERGSSLDRFAPGWRDNVDINLPDPLVRTAIFRYWRNLIQRLRGMKVADAVQLISGNEGQPLYWLAFASRHPLGHKFWQEIQPPSAPEQEELFGGTPQA